jgi:hypothetical protein
MGQAPNSALLPAASTLPDQLIGLRVNVADNCICNSRKAVVGDDHVLQCIGCGVSRGRFGPRTTKFITEFINKFGLPTEPIELRRPIGEIDSLDLITAANSGQVLINWRTRQRQFGRR